MNNKKGFVILSIIVFFLTAVIAEPKNSKDIVPAEYYEQLKNEGIIRVIHYDGEDNDLLLLPSTKFKSEFKQRRTKDNKKLYNFVSESLYLIDKSEIVEKSNKKTSEVTIEDVSIVFRSISKMEGIKYYSHNRKRWDVLYKESYLVDNPKDRKPIEDPIEGFADSRILYCMQKDASFGRCLYELTFLQDDENFFASFNNMERMGLGPFSAISPRDMFINIAVVDCEDQIVLYLMTECNSVKFPNIKNLLKDSLISRIDAIQKWFLSAFI